MRYLITAMVTVVMAFTPMTAEAKKRVRSCDRIAVKMPKKSSLYDPFHLSNWRAVSYAYRKACNRKIIRVGRWGRDFRAQMTPAQFKRCAQLTHHGKKVYSRVIKEIKTDKDLESAKVILRVNKTKKHYEQHVLVFGAKFVAKAAAPVLLGVAMQGAAAVSVGAGTLGAPGGAGVVMALMKGQCRIKAIQNTEVDLVEHVRKEGKFVYEVNFIRTANSRGVSFLQEVVAYHLKAGGKRYVLPLRIMNAEIQLTDPPRRRTRRRSVTTEKACVLAGSQIAMADGSLTAIELVKVGDRIVSYDTVKGKKVLATVTQTLRHPNTEQIVMLNGETLGATDYHRVFTGSGWVRADELVEGSSVLSLAGNGEISSLVLQGAAMRAASGVTTFNLAVDGPKNFFANGILVKSE